MPEDVDGLREHRLLELFRQRAKHGRHGIFEVALSPLADDAAGEQQRHRLIAAHGVPELVFAISAKHVMSSSYRTWKRPHGYITRGHSPVRPPTRVSSSRPRS